MFCEFCGKAIRDEAYVCPFCHRQLKVFPAEIMAEQQALLPSRKFFRLAKIFAIIATVFSGITLLCGAWSLFMIIAGVLLGDAGGMLLVLYSIFGWIAMVGCSPFALIMGILAFVFKRKSVQPTGAFPTVAFILGIVACSIGLGTYLLMIVS